MLLMFVTGGWPQSPAAHVLKVFGVVGVVVGDMRGPRVSQTDHRHSGRVVAVSGNADSDGEGVQVCGLVGSERDSSGTDVLIDSPTVTGPWDRYDPRLLCEQPCQRDLTGCDGLGVGEGAHVIHQSLIGAEVVGGETRDRGSRRRRK